ncbi:PaaX family transcriptional regulator C-terminal domain-containing protein [Streptomyces caeni]|uniref:PaaX family transcriptional regulator C-terminal domain-containing protein n=1 Tax=Streptomyces caeni TaxID=2307231 RepID=A0ABW4J225_9ACTN
MAEPADLMAPLSARSVALSLLLGARPPRLSARDLTCLGEMFEISAPTMRVALSRMVASGDLVPADSMYALPARHLERQAATESLIHPRRRPYDGMWRMAVVVDRGRSLARRTSLRSLMRRHRFAELREGVWMRPDNIEQLLTPSPHEGAGTESATALSEARTFRTVPDNDRRLSRELWDLDQWAADARVLLDALRDDGPSKARPVDRLTAAAAAVRHLCTDPALPEELAPERWPADELRWAYEDYRNELSAICMAGTAVPRAQPAADASKGM